MICLQDGWAWWSSLLDSTSSNFALSFFSSVARLSNNRLYVIWVLWLLFIAENISSFRSLSCPNSALVCLKAKMSEVKSSMLTQNFWIALCCSGDSTALPFNQSLFHVWFEKIQQAFFWRLLSLLDFFWARSFQKPKWEFDCANSILLWHH